MRIDDVGDDQSQAAAGRPGASAALSLMLAVGLVGFALVAIGPLLVAAGPSVGWFRGVGPLTRWIQDHAIWAALVVTLGLGLSVVRGDPERRRR